MQKIKHNQDKNQLFSFNNSFKNSYAASPSSSKYLSIDSATLLSTNFSQVHLNQVQKHNHSA